MARIGLTEAAKLTGKSPSTITRRSNHKDIRKRMSFTTNDNGDRVYDIAELERVFGKLKDPLKLNNAIVQKEENASERNNLQQQLKEMHEHEVALLREQNALLHEQFKDIQKDRDEWRNQAKQHSLLIEDHRTREVELKDKLKATEKPEEQSKKIFGLFSRRTA